MGWTEFRDYPELSRAEIIRRELSQAPTADNLPAVVEFFDVHLAAMVDAVALAGIGAFHLE